MKVANSDWFSKTDSPFFITYFRALEDENPVGEDIFHCWNAFLEEIIKKPVHIKWNQFDVEERKSKTHPEIKRYKRKLKPGQNKGFSFARFGGKGRCDLNSFEHARVVVLDFDDTKKTSDEFRKIIDSLPYGCIWSTTLSHNTNGWMTYRAYLPVEGDPNWNGLLTAREHLIDVFKEHGLIADNTPKAKCQFWFHPSYAAEKDYAWGVSEKPLVHMKDAPSWKKDVIPDTQRHPITVPKSSRANNRSELYDFGWVDSQMQEYLGVGPGERAAWLGPKGKTLGGILGGGGFVEGVNEHSLAARMMETSQHNIGRSWEEEFKFILGAIKKGMMEPLESKKKARASKEIAEVADKPTNGQPGDFPPWIKALRFGKDHTTALKRVDNYHKFIAQYYGDRLFWDELSWTAMERVDGRTEKIESNQSRQFVNSWLAGVEGVLLPDIPKPEYADTLTHEARKRTVNVIRERLEGTSTDGAIAAEDVATEIFCAADTVANRMAITYFLFSTVARWTAVGATDVQAVPIVKGKGGFGKTSFSKSMGLERYQCKTGKLAMDRDFYNSVQNTLMLELGEAQSGEMTSEETMKALITSDTATFNQKYETGNLERPNRYGMIVTCNEWPPWANDRRYLPVEVGVVKEKTERVGATNKFPKGRWHKSLMATLALVYRRIKEGFDWQSILTTHDEAFQQAREEAMHVHAPVFASAVRVAVAKCEGMRQSTPSSDEIMDAMELPKSSWSKEKKNVHKALRYSGFEQGTGARGKERVWGWKNKKVEEDCAVEL